MKLIALLHVLLDVVLDVLIQTLLPPFAVDVLLEVVAVVGLHIKFFIMWYLAQTVMIYITKIMIYTCQLMG